MGTASARQPRPQTIVYVDGLNLYYGALKGTPHKWLDLVRFAGRLRINDDIVRVR
ncbi:MAG TPA: hypothetical protein VFY71_09685 [Planctomycetota bacterium]|nr:hypothetical protein [Planctomycetota bacterium]